MYEIGEVSRIGPPMVISNKYQGLLSPIARRCDCTALDGWYNREACPDISVTINKTVVHCLFAVTGRRFGPSFLESKLRRFTGDIEDDRSTRSGIKIKTNKVDVVSIDD
jgi:hypothetical protein